MAMAARALDRASATVVEATVAPTSVGVATATGEAMAVATVGDMDTVMGTGAAEASSTSR
jgi:hypothetical protein